jgi:uncharacterized protein YegP (UPF0339 family)
LKREPRFEIFNDRARKYRWRLRAANGMVIATSGEGYTRVRRAREGISAVVKNAPKAPKLVELITTRRRKV